MDIHKAPKRHLHTSFATATAALLAACGGGGNSDNRATESSASAGVATASKTLLVSGVVSGLDGLTVNGLRYTTDGAQVRVEEEPATLADIEVGHVVRLDALIDAAGQAKARSIDLDDLVQGAVESVDVAAGRLTIAGQPIRVDGTTVFESSIPGRSLAGVAVGDRLEVHGHAAANGPALATRIERADGDDRETEVTGFVAAVDGVNRELRVGVLRVDLSTATLRGFDADGPAVGQLVEVEGREFRADGALQATRVTNEHAAEANWSGDGREVEGLVTRFVSASDFDVAGRPVTTAPDTRYVAGTAAQLALGVRVEVEGQLDSSGRLVAREIEFEGASSARLEGPVVAVATASSSLEVLGLTIVVDDRTIRQDRNGGSRTFDVADLRAGDWVEVAGYVEGGRVIATRLERDRAESEVEVDGVATDVGAGGLSVLGIRIDTTAATRFSLRDRAIDAAEFAARASGELVEVEGTWNGASVVAREVEIDAARN